MSAPICLDWWSIPRWWRVPWRRLHLDPSSGRVRFVFRPCGHPVQGEAWRTGGRWYVLRAEGCELLLQVGTHKLRLPEIKSFTLERQGRGRATATIETVGDVWRIEYHPAALRWWNRLDPAFDGLDEELSDFPLRVMRQWEATSRGSELAVMWSSSATLSSTPSAPSGR